MAVYINQAKAEEANRIFDSNCRQYACPCERLSDAHLEVERTKFIIEMIPGAFVTDVIIRCGGDMSQVSINVYFCIQ